MTDTKQLAPAQPTPAQRELMYQAVNNLAASIDRVHKVWDEHFEHDAYTPESGYPFTESLDEVCDKVHRWADGTWQDWLISMGQA